MHPKNRYQGPHDFPGLCKIVPELAEFLITTPDDRISLDFTSPEAVRRLNQALLLRDYGLKFWDIPKGNLCPGVPGRLDYIHVIADLLTPPGGHKNKGKRPVTGIDIGTGASLIYPILGAREYGWSFLGTDVEDASLKVAGAIASFNPGLDKKVTLRKQHQRNQVFRGIIREGERYDFSMCNPPFFADEAGATSAAESKWDKLGQSTTTGHNFGGKANELWTPGGEPAFLRRMILESVEFKDQVTWFTTLVSKKGYLFSAKQLLEKAKVRHRKVIQMGKGGKIRRVLAWRF